jgi:hypothetical protein
MRVMLIEGTIDTLIEERYKDTVMNDSTHLVHWDTLEISEDDYRRYEELRIELYELTEQLKERATK